MCILQFQFLSIKKYACLFLFFACISDQGFSLGLISLLDLIFDEFQNVDIALMYMCQLDQ